MVLGLKSGQSDRLRRNVRLSHSCTVAYYRYLITSLAGTAAFFIIRSPVGAGEQRRWDFDAE